MRTRAVTKVNVEFEIERDGVYGPSVTLEFIYNESKREAEHAVQGLGRDIDGSVKIIKCEVKTILLEG